MTSVSSLVQEFPMFHTGSGKNQVENYEEFDDAREVVASLSAEYEACEQPDYIERSRTAAQHPTTAANDTRISVT